MLMMLLLIIMILLVFFTPKANAMESEHIVRFILETYVQCTLYNVPATPVDRPVVDGDETAFYYDAATVHIVTIGLFSS